MTAPPELVATLTFVHPAVSTGEEALRLLAGAAVEQGYAADTFPDALLTRERTYPTGLPLPLPVAIPHADAGHVLRPGIAALVPRSPLDFGEMGSADRRVAVELVLMLLVDDPADQVGLLATLITALQRTDLRDRLVGDLTDADQLVRRFADLMAQGSGP